ncbi:putative transporter-like protein [Hapsidospora chrysogenum ATCC 11550]|uniref:Putative transporter-like protein n=1 Tax=Hapsidospora chrysogenum (strain ATCC 11550 / CBS 779.69 / DSM 880 / IAM 14645 / JCM 23072 / IMI 49137) TaxID=857340 RepID=A0A086SY84_HAPC1|nr:putative transporter-like protein [Hapsidospora chrysogenum ATCC 11550]
MSDKDRDVETGKEAAASQAHVSDSQDLTFTEIDSVREKKLLLRQDLRIIPLSAGIYLLCYLDRSNIGNAKVLNSDTGDDLLSDTGMTAYQYTIALMVFLIAYALFEIPSNYFLKRLRPSRWIAFLMFSWGAITMGLGGTNSYAAVAVTRFLLGVFEAAAILASATLAGAFGGAIAYGVGHMNQVRGLSGWRWLFILEGMPSVVSALFVWFLLPDYPETARWLSAEEKFLAAHRLAQQGSKGSSASMTWEDAKSTLLEWRLWCHYIFKDLEAQLMTVPPYACAYVATLAASWSADHHNACALHSVAFSLIGAAGFIASAVLPADAFTYRYGCLIVAASGSFACIPPLLGWLSSNLHSTAAIGLAIALNISMGAPGQIVGVWIYTADEAVRGYPTGHWINAGFLIMVAAGCLGLRSYYAWRNRVAAGACAPLFRY